jgi:hypothetical protein
MLPEGALRGCEKGDILAPTGRKFPQKYVFIRIALPVQDW